MCVCVCLEWERVNVTVHLSRAACTAELGCVDTWFQVPVLVLREANVQHCATSAGLSARFARQARGRGGD